MNVFIVSECEGKALTETRRILDQFAERRGKRTWQTPITKDGLDALHKLLRRTARRNTAVACHWIRGLNHTEFLWVVGQRSKFSNHGAVPTNSTSANVTRLDEENDWVHSEDIHLMASLAALLHDLGKASDAFQQRLKGQLTERNIYRHEWVSLRLFQAFVGVDDDVTWLTRLVSPTAFDDKSWGARLQRDGIDGDLSPNPFSALRHAPVAQAIGWLVLTHHRLPAPPANSDETKYFQIGLVHRVLEKIDADWNERADTADRLAIESYWRFSHGLPVTTLLWRKRAARIANGLLNRLKNFPKTEWLSNPFVMHVSRMCLMLADHYYSRLQGTDSGRISTPTGYPLFANTTQSGSLNQTLDEHLLGVAIYSAQVTKALPRFELHLPRLAKCRALTRRSQGGQFRWQDKSADLAGTVREKSMQQGAFIVNMASTGCGKTLANARVMYALSDPERGMRCSFALGLRTLTFQTGQAFRNLLDLSDTHLAIRVGGTASRELFDHFATQAEARGSASAQALIDEHAQVHFEGSVSDHPVLHRAIADPNVRAMLFAPLLVCTIDHLTPATESQRGGRQIAPMLRLMSGDLVLDEPDDFEVADLPALTRLVHWAGLLGARVLLSSATLPPSLVEGLFAAYREGRYHFASNCGGRHEGIDQLAPICCLWLDEFTQSQVDCSNRDSFVLAHEQFIERRSDSLAKCESRRLVQIIPLELSGVPRTEMAAKFALRIFNAAIELHRAHHSTDPVTGRRVSFGLIRMANIEPLVDVALSFFTLSVPRDVQVHLCVYHSQFPLLIRSAIERRLDAALDRRDPLAVFALQDIRQRIDGSQAAEQLFIVLGSPVTEVGRDHDYDWAVVEPSSMRSIIQLAGRVRRHRGGRCKSVNIVVLNANLRHFQSPDEPAYYRPGYETNALLLNTHALELLWPESADGRIDAQPRFRPPSDLKPRDRLADLEHERIRLMMLPRLEDSRHLRGTRQRLIASPTETRQLCNAASWWNLPPQDALLCGVLQQQQPFRHDPIPRVDLLLRPNEDGTDMELVFLSDSSISGLRNQSELVVERSMHRRIADEQVTNSGMTPWAEMDYVTSLEELAAALDISAQDCARRFSTVRVPASQKGWRFHPVLGFTKCL